MNYSQFFDMIPEAVLTAILVIVFIADFASSGKDVRKWFNPLAGLLLLGELVVCLMPLESVSLFGGMYVTSPAVNVMKAILSGGTLLVVIMARQWIGREEGRAREGEFYMLVVSTLLGMFVMMSSGHFLLFFLGLEMASVPMACLVALDKYRNNSAEAAAKYILTATFSSGVMLFGVSYLYGATGTLYFADVAGALSVSALSILGLVFFFSGLAFKISLVPFHFWTADTYQGAPTVVTGYLSVVSKGAAAFTLMAILMKVFGAMVEEWHLLLYIVIVLSITVGNLFAMRQRELKRFMAFSSISQAGYIMLAVAGDSQASVTALSFYVLVYVAANLSVFAIINVVEQNNHGLTDMDSYNGFYRTNPKLAFLMTLALFSLAGIPVCRYVQQVLRVHGGGREYVEGGVCRCLRGIDQYRDQPVLLPAHRESHVYQGCRGTASRFQERLQYPSGTCRLYPRRTGLRCMQLYLSVDLRCPALMILPGF